MNTILVAMAGKRSMLNALLKPIMSIFGATDEPAPDAPKMNPAMFRAMFSK